MIDQAKRAALSSDIEAHLLASGSCDWRTVRDRHSDISNATFWRIVRKVKEAKTRQAGPVIPPSTDPGVSGGPTGSASATSILFAGILSTAYLTSEFERALQDLEKLHEYCVDAEGKVIRPSTFIQYLKTRERLVGDIMHRRLQLLTEDAEDARWRAMVAAFADLDRDLYRKVVDAIKEVHKTKFRTIEVVGPP
jgi:hypothetical protein